MEGAHIPLFFPTPLVTCPPRLPRVKSVPVQGEAGETSLKGREATQPRKAQHTGWSPPTPHCAHRLLRSPGTPTQTTSPAEPRGATLPREPLAPHRPGHRLDPTAYLMLVNLQPLEARLLKVAGTGLQGEETALAFCPMCAWPDC